jgi:hypothetical protein
VHDDRSMDDVNEIMTRLGKPMKRIDASSSTDMEQLEKVNDAHGSRLMIGIENRTQGSQLV